MSTKFTSLYGKVLSFLMLLIGFSSCDENNGKAEYGTPSATFKVNGTVVDNDTGEPVPGLRTTLTSSDNQWYAVDMLSGEQGNFILNVEAFPSNKATFELKIEDIDGPANGEYETFETDVVFENPEYTGGNGHWYEGETTKNIGSIKVKRVPEE